MKLHKLTIFEPAYFPQYAHIIYCMDIKLLQWSDRSRVNEPHSYTSTIKH